MSIEALDRFFRSSAVPMTLADARADDCPLILANDAFCELTGYRREDVVGRNCRFLQGPNTDPRARQRMHQAIEAGTEVLVPVTNYRKDGREFENYVFIVPILAPGGEVLYFMGSQYDITAPYRAVSLEEQAKLLEEGAAEHKLRSGGFVGSLLRFRAEGRGG
jgi:PAS domain S-box-containing protein